MCIKWLIYKYCHNERHSYVCDVDHSWVLSRWQTFRVERQSWKRLHVYHVTHSWVLSQWKTFIYVWRESFMGTVTVTDIQSWKTFVCVSRDSFMRTVTYERYSYVYDVNHSYVILLIRDSFISTVLYERHSYVYHVTHSWVLSRMSTHELSRMSTHSWLVIRDWFICVSRDSFMRTVTMSTVTYEWVTSYTYRCLLYVTVLVNESRHTHMKDIHTCMTLNIHMWHYSYVPLLMNESRHTHMNVFVPVVGKVGRKSHVYDVVTHSWGMLHISSVTYEWLASYTYECLSYATLFINESRMRTITYQRFTSYTYECLSTLPTGSSRWRRCGYVSVAVRDSSCSVLQCVEVCCSNFANWCKWRESLKGWWAWMNGWCHAYRSYHIHEWIMSLVWMSHVTCMHEWVLSHEVQI